MLLFCFCATCFNLFFAQARVVNYLLNPEPIDSENGHRVYLENLYKKECEWFDPTEEPGMDAVEMTEVDYN